MSNRDAGESVLNTIIDDENEKKKLSSRMKALLTSHKVQKRIWAVIAIKYIIQAYCPELLEPLNIAIDVLSIVLGA